VRGHLEAVLPLVTLEDVVGVDAQVAERVDGDQDMPDIGVYLATLEALLQVFVDSFVGDLAQQGQVGDANFLLLRDFEGGFLGPCAGASACTGGASLRALCAFVLGAPRYTLDIVSEF